MSLMMVVSIVSGMLFTASAVLFYLYGKDFFFQGPPLYVYIVSGGMFLAAVTEITASTFSSEPGMFYGLFALFASTAILTGFVKGFMDSRGGVI